MLVTFSCEAYENITMFGDVALRLIKMMGHTGTIPSAIVAENVPAALTNLESAIEKEKQKPTQSIPPSVEEDEDEEEKVSLAHRALPLIALLKAAVKKNCDVMWE